jgi:glycosyltransferase involved in cell wall biosynthesis
MSDEEEPVSVIVPAFNAEQTINETLLSVRRQTYRNLEIIVVDDGSTDRTYQRASDHSRVDRRIRLIKQSNGGVAAARNRGIAEAQADLIAPIDADDLWRPNKIARQLRALRAAGPEAMLVYTWSALVDEGGKVIDWGTHPSFTGDVLLELCHGNFVGNGSTALTRKSALKELGGYDTSLKARKAQGCEDWRLFLQIAEGGHFAVVPDYLTGYRQVPTAMSRDVEQMLRSDALVRSEMLMRHPEYRLQIKSGRRSYTDWMFRRELDDCNWSACFRLLRRLVLKDDSRLPSARRTCKCALRIVARVFGFKSSLLSNGPQYLPIESLTTLEDDLNVTSDPAQD